MYIVNYIKEFKLIDYNIYSISTSNILAASSYLELPRTEL